MYVFMFIVKTSPISSPRIGDQSSSRRWADLAASPSTAATKSFKMPEVGDSSVSNETPGLREILAEQSTSGLCVSQSTPRPAKLIFNYQNFLFVIFAICSNTSVTYSYSLVR